MIIISMGAGLGNQMFEYSFYEALCRQYPNTEIKVDTKYAFPRAHNGIELFNIFNIKPKEASLEEIKKLVGLYPLKGDGYKINRVASKIANVLKLYPKSLLLQKDFTEYYQEFFNLDITKNYYIYGPFANSQYFKNMETEIKNLYIFPEIVDDKNKVYAMNIKNTESVSLHVRRGDYIKEGIQLISHGFYMQAINIIKETINKPHFYIFTDDIEYCKKEFIGDDFTFIEGNNGINSFRDMQLMSLCKHNIIANSSFSFWGAFLNNNSGKTVIAPNVPFTGCKFPFTCDDWVMI